MIREELKAALDSAKELFGIPSYSATCYYKGETFSFSNGICSIESNEEVNGDTMYAIGSCTKSFVAGAICTLADQGLLTLDDKIKEYIPEFEMMDSYVSQNLTIRDMLCHRCGLPRHELSWYSRLDTLTEEEIISMFRYMEPNKPFRYTWQYNNQMFALAGFLIRRITGKSWEDVVRENIWAPLGITRGAFTPEEAMAMGNCATPHSKYPGEDAIHPVPHANIGAMGSAGSIYMSTNDQVKWAAMLLNGGKYNGKQIISEELCREMWTTQMVRPNESDAPMKPYVFHHGYGLGLETEVFLGHRLIHHGGHIDGFIADQSFLPEDDYAIAILTNTDAVRGAQYMRYIASETILGQNNDIAVKTKEFLEEQAAALKEGNDKIWAEKPENMPCPISLEAIAGTYNNKGYGDMIISVDGDKLSIKLGTLTLTGTHYANNFFYLEDGYSMPGLLMEACVDLDVKANVIGFAAAFEPEASKKIYFTRK